MLDEDPHAVSSAAAAALALTSPVPVSSVRRDGPSFMFSVSIASSTFGSTFLIAIPQRSRISVAAALGIQGQTRRYARVGTYRAHSARVREGPAMAHRYRTRFVVSARFWVVG